jgi:hypothetical protein
MFRQRSSGCRRRARRARAWRLWLAVIAGCGAAVLAVHVATAPRTLNAASSAYLFRVHSATSGDAGHRGYGRGGYTAGTTSPGTGSPPPGTGTPGAGRHHHHHN